MQETTKRELRQVKATVRKVLIKYPATRGNDNALYYKVCKEHAAQIGVDLSEVHFSTVFLGNPLGFPRYESVVRLRRMVQRKEPELQADRHTKANRRKKQADMIEYARNRGITQ